MRLMRCVNNAKWNAFDRLKKLNVSNGARIVSKKHSIIVAGIRRTVIITANESIGKRLEVEKAKKKKVCEYF